MNTMQTSLNINVPRVGRTPNRCLACDRQITDGPDPCIGMIPGVAGACCGHGNPGRAYVVWGGMQKQTFREHFNPAAPITKVSLRGSAALTFFNLIRERGEWTKLEGDAD
jgi:hypothetical protein